MKYFFTVSFQDENQPLCRHRDNMVVDIENLASMDVYDVTRVLASHSYNLRNVSDLVVEFIMPMGEAK